MTPAIPEPTTGRIRRDYYVFGDDRVNPVRRILDRHTPNRQNDWHSWSHFNYYGGMTSSAYCYMQNFPYYNRLWYGRWKTCNPVPSTSRGEKSRFQAGRACC